MSQKWHLSGFFRRIGLHTGTLSITALLRGNTWKHCEMWSHQNDTSLSLKYCTNAGNTKGCYVSIYFPHTKMDVPGVLYMKPFLLWFFVWSLSYKSPLKVNSRWGNGGRCYSNNILKYESVESWLVLKGNDLVCDYGIRWSCVLMQTQCCPNPVHMELKKAALNVRFTMRDIYYFCWW